MGRLLAALIAGLVATPAVAGDINVQVRDQHGQPLPDAVVMIRPVSAGPTPAVTRFAGPMVMAQQDIQFSPHLLIVPLGAVVSFPNRDRVRHHVYSFSPAKRFELKLYGRDETRTVLFDKPGPVSLGCNIHDGMIGFIYVTDTPYTAKSGPDGDARIHDAPTGAAVLSVWRPDLKDRTELKRSFTVSAGPQSTVVALELRSSPTR